MTEKGMQNYQIRDFEEKSHALSMVEKQYPEMTKLRETLRDNPQEFRRLYPIMLIECVSNQLGVPMSGIDILGGKPYVNKTGLTCRVQKDKRRVEYMKTFPVLYPMDIKLLNTPADEDFKKYFIGCSQDGTAVSHAIVKFQDGSVYEDEGSANAKYLNKQWGKMSTMVPYIMELAATRAMNRAMRLATGIGLVSVEELNERGYTLIQDEMKNETSGKKAELILEIQGLYKKLKFNDAKQLMHNNKFGGVADLEMISEDNLGKLLFTLNEIKPKGFFK